MAAKSEGSDGGSGREGRVVAEISTHEQQSDDSTEPREAANARVCELEQPLAQTVARIMDGYADRPALGERATELVTDPSTGRTWRRLLPEFETISYGELWARVGAVSAEFQQDARHPATSGDVVGILGFTSGDYATVDLACLHLGGVCVPLQTSASLAQLTPILDETRPRVLAASIEYLDNAVELVLSSESTPRLVVFDYRPDVDDEREKFEAARERLTEAGITAIDSLAEVLERGRALPTVPVYAAGAGEDPLRLLIYTSGSTGTPKGAIYTESMLRRQWAAALSTAGNPSTIGMNYMPMSHLAGRNSLIGALARGGTAYFTASSDLSTLFEDIGLVRPSELVLVPRICDMLRQQYQSESDRRATEFDDPAALDAAVKTDLRDRILGGRVSQVTCSSAPVSSEMTTFVESCLDLHLHNAYGSTECGRVLIDGQVQRPPVLEYTLVDVPELGYFHTDLPHPRGELLLKTESITPGYYRRPEATAEVFDEHGFYRTGDIMAEIAPDQLSYIDRRNNVLKLAQGEFVAVSHLEAVFAASPLVRQIFVYGNSERAYLLAVIVPTDEALAQASDETELKSMLSQSLQHTAAEAELNSYEIPRDFLVETEPFTVENGLLSEIRKLLRPRLRDHYGPRLEALYSEIAQGQASELRALRQAGADQPVGETVSRAARALLGCSRTDLHPTAHFLDLGGDSLSALSFSNLLQEIFDVEVPVGVIISPANNLRQIAQHIETARSSAAQRPTCATVHGQDSGEVHAHDLALEHFIDTDTLTTATTLPHPSGHTPHTVLLTGATGYLGRFLCLDWLQRLAETGGTLTCIVRGSDAATARQRLDDAFNSGDAELTRHYQQLASRHLEVLAGDIGEPNLGLDKATWHRLATEIDVIVHPAALVNHMLPYAQLFGPNVVGTAELIRMAITTTIKPFTYLSTVGVAAQLDPATLDEDADIRSLSPVRKLDDTYASGYGTSKWAGEILLREANETCGLPVTTFRSDMILAHSRYTGQLNVPDMFTRLLLSLLATGIAPHSFYRTDPQGNRQRAHYDGLPVDFTAEAINTLGARTTQNYRTYNVINPHDDGLSLDTVADWLHEAGYPLHRVTDYDDWYSRFDTALRALPETQRQHSLLPLLHALQHPDEPLHGSEIPAHRFHTAVQKHHIGTDNNIPHLTAALITKYATDLQQLNLL